MENPDQKECWKCGAAIDAGQAFCSSCGAQQGAQSETTSEPVPAKGFGCGRAILIGLAVLFGLAVLGILLNPDGMGPSSTFSQSSRSSLNGGSSGFSVYTITINEYNQIRDGMSYSEVVRIIGEPGTELSSGDIAGFRTVMYSWENFNGSNANVMFQNDRMINKAQFGLP